MLLVVPRAKKWVSHRLAIEKISGGKGRCNSHVGNGAPPRISRLVIWHLYDGVVWEALDEETSLIATIPLPKPKEVVIDRIQGFGIGAHERSTVDVDMLIRSTGPENGREQEFLRALLNRVADRSQLLEWLQICLPLLPWPEIYRVKGNQ